MLCCQLGAARLCAASGGADCGSLQSPGAGGSLCRGDTDSFRLEDVLVRVSHLKLLKNSIPVLP